MGWVILLVMACSTTPTVASVEPARVEVGATLTVRGEHLDGAALRLHEQESSVALEQVTADEALARGTVPEGTRARRYDLVIDRRGELVVVADAVEVVPSFTERPCSDQFTANTELSLARDEVVVDRYYRNGDRQRVRLDLSEIGRVEYERIDDVPGCSAVFLRTAEGKRVVFHDAREVDLRARATKLAEVMGKELVVVGEDAAAMGEPE